MNQDEQIKQLKKELIELKTKLKKHEDRIKDNTRILQ